MGYEPHSLPYLPASRTEERLLQKFWTLFVADRYKPGNDPPSSALYPSKQRIVEELRELSPFSEVRAPRPLPELDASELTHDSFREATNGMRHSIVIRGLAKDVEAVQRWNKEYLLEKLEGYQIPVGQSESLTTPKFTNPSLRLMPFDEYVEHGADEKWYAINCSTMFSHCPELDRQIQLEEILAKLYPPQKRYDEIMNNIPFVGHNGVHSYVHSSPGGNFFFMLVGKKYWNLWDPTYSAHLHAMPGKPFQYCWNEFSVGTFLEGAIGRPEDTFLHKLPRYETTLEPGDVLYNGPWWWHEVVNLSAFTVGSGFRYARRPFEPSPTIRNSPVMGLTSAYPLARMVVAAHAMGSRVSGKNRPLREIGSAVQTLAFQFGALDLKSKVKAALPR